MRIVNAIIKKTQFFDPNNRYIYRIVLIREDGTRTELPGNMSLVTAIAVQKLYRKNV